jgi:hypothetical protein
MHEHSEISPPETVGRSRNRNPPNFDYGASGREVRGIISPPSRNPLEGIPRGETGQRRGRRDGVSIVGPSEPLMCGS